MQRTELGDAGASHRDHLLGHRQHDANVVGIVETAAGQTEDALLAHQRLHELHLVVDARKGVHIDADHHVHGAVRPNRSQAVDGVEQTEGDCGVFLSSYWSGVENVLCE